MRLQLKRQAQERAVRMQEDLKLRQQVQQRLLSQETENVCSFSLHYFSHFSSHLVGRIIVV